MPTMTKSEKLKALIESNNRGAFYSSVAFDKKEEGKEEDYIRSCTFSSESEDVNDNPFFAIKLLHGSQNADFTRIIKSGKAFKKHETFSDPIGKLLNVRIVDRKGKCDILFNKDDANAVDTLAKIDGGFLDAVSVGYRLIDIKETGRTNKYGKEIIEAVRWEAIEVSIVPIEADINAGFGRNLDINNNTKEIFKMTEEEKKALLEDHKRAIEETARKVEAETKAKMEAEFLERENKRKLEEKAVNEIKNSISRIQECYGKDCLTETQVREIESTRNIDIAYRFLVENKKSTPFEVKTSVSHERQENFTRAMTNGIFAKTKHFDMKELSTLDKDSIGFRQMPLIELCKDLIVIRGEKTRDELRVMSPMKIASLAIGTRGISNGTSDFANILIDAMNKTAQKALMLAPDAGWREIADEVTVNDFRDIHSLAMANMPSFKDYELDEGGKYKSVRVGDHKETYSVGTFAYKFSLSRQAIVNDNMGMFNRIVPSIGMSAERLVMELIADIIVANASMGKPAGALFSTAHANLQGDLAPSIANIQVLAKALALQTEMPVDGVASNRILGFPLKHILCTEATKIYFEEIIASKLNTDTAGSNKENLFYKKLNLIVSPSLYTALKNAGSGAEYNWFGLCDKMLCTTFEVASLRGEEGLTIEQITETDVDGVAFRARVDKGAGVIDYRGIQKSAYDG